MPNLTDKFQKTGAATVTTLSAPGKALAAASITVGSTTNYPVDTGFTVGIRVVDATGKLVDGSYTEWTATVSSGTTLSLSTVPVYGSDRVYAPGSTTQVFIPVSAFSHNRLVDGLLNAFNQDATLKQAAVQAALGIASIPPADWTSLPVVPLLTASNGQKENVLQFTGVDYTDRLQKGTKLRIPRTSTVPTQSAKFIAASSQYANKVTPAGMTFTDNFTLECYVNPASYVQGAIIGRSDVGPANGFVLRLEATGQVTLAGNNAGSGNYRFASTYQSVPLNKRTHIAATWATGTLLIYLDGVLVPSIPTAAGTSPTTIVQGGDLAIGRNGSNAAQYFNGEVSDVRIHSVVKTAAQIRDNMGKQLVGNEANLVGYWKLNGDFLDSTANANHLTAQAGAVATTVGHAFSPIEYVIVTSTPVFAAGNTTCTGFTGNGVLPNETLGATSYSGQRAPFGFPADKGKWSLTSLTSLEWTPSSSGSLQLTTTGLTVPVGEWSIKSKFTYDLEVVGTGSIPEHMTGIGTTIGASIIGSQFTVYNASNVTAMRMMLPITIAGIDISVGTAIPYYILASKIGTTTARIRNNVAPSTLTVDCNLL